MQAVPELPVGKSGRGDDVQSVTGIGETGGEGQSLRTTGGSLVLELLEAGLVDDVTEVFLSKRDVNVV